MCLLFFILVCVTIVTHTTADYYVSERGNDNNKGTSLQSAFRTPERALTATKSDSHRPLTIYFDKGTYYLSKPLQLDSSTSQTTWQALNHSSVVLSGGKTITGWRKSDSTTLVADVASGSVFTQLFVDDRTAVRARLPACQYPADCRQHYSRGYDINNTYQYAEALSPQGAGFHYHDTDFDPNWPDLHQAVVVVFKAWTAEWFNVASVDGNTKTVTFKQTTKKIGKWASVSAKRYVIENVKAGLTSPGQFYHDTTANRLYYKPISSDEQQKILSGDIVPVIPTLTSVVKITDNCKDVTLDTLTFAHTTDGADARFNAYFATSGALWIQQVDSITVRNCAVKHHGQSGVLVYNNVTNLKLVGNYINNIGGDGISMLSAKGVYNVLIHNNHVNDTGRFFMRQPASIRVKGVSGIMVSHNEVSHNSYGGILVGWEPLPNSGQPYPTPLVAQVQYNYVHDYGLGILCDFGGVYLSSSDNTCFKNGPGACDLPVIVYQNFITRGRHFYSKPHGYGSNGIYMDEQVSAVYMESNLITHMGSSGIYFHCGDNNTAINNIIASCGEQDGSGYIKGCNGGGNPTWPNLIHGFRWHKNIVSVTDPSLQHSTDWRATNFDYNVYYNTQHKAMSFPGNVPFSQWQKTGNDTHSVVADPQFFDANAGNFTLKPGSPPLKLGFQQIDQHQYGPM